MLIGFSLCLCCERKVVLVLISFEFHQILRRRDWFILQLVVRSVEILVLVFLMHLITFNWYDNKWFVSLFIVNFVEISIFFSSNFRLNLYLYFTIPFINSSYHCPDRDNTQKSVFQVLLLCWLYIHHIVPHLHCPSLVLLIDLRVRIYMELSLFLLGYDWIILFDRAYIDVNKNIWNCSSKFTLSVHDMLNI